MIHLKSPYYPFYKANHNALKITVYQFIGILLIFFSFSATSATQSQIESIQQAAQNYILDTIEWPAGGTLEAKAANIDSRVFATDCPTTLLTSSSSTNSASSNITVMVECVDDDWRMYVPVRLTKTGPQVTLINPINKGQIIAQSDVTVTMVDLQRIRRQGFSSVNAVTGAKAKKNLRVGNVIRQNDICVVCRNETVTIKAVKSGMTITTKGTALSDGSHGEQIRVKNSKSNRIIEANVSGIAEVSVVF